jgi:hypothetical protein
VISRGIGDDAARPSGLGKRGDHVVRAAEFEGSDFLEVLAFESQVETG